MSSRRIAVLGAGSIGCFVGGMLARGGHRVTLVARPRIIDAIRANGLRLTSADSLDAVVPAERLTLSDAPEVLADAEIILVTVKSNDTRSAADLIARHGAPGAVVISLQNGVGNAAVLREKLPGRAVLAGMVPFNVQSLGDGRFHRATSGDLVIARDAANTAAALSVAGLALRATDDIIAVQWGKLVLNLNNALNALSGLKVRAQLAERAWRQLMADQWAEALAVLHAANIRIVSATPVPASWTPFLLRLPDWLFEPVLGRTMTIDPSARSSMSDDLLRGRPTEIDFLQGVIVELADKHGLDAPLTRRVVDLIKQAEAAGKGLPNLTPEQVRTGSSQASTKGAGPDRSPMVTSASSAPFAKSPHLLDALVVGAGLVSGFLTPLILNFVESFNHPAGTNGIVLMAGGIPFALLILAIARDVAQASWWRATALGALTLVAMSVSITVSANTNAALGSIAEPTRELIGGPVGGVIGSGLMALSAMLLRIGPRHPARWAPLVVVGTILGLLLALDVWLGSENVWVIFPVWQASIAFVLLRTVQAWREAGSEA